MSDPISAGLGLIDTFLNKFVADKDLAAKLAMQARSEEFQGELSLLLGQMAINEEEAKSDSLFVAGWRPFVGWVCGFSLAYNFILYPIVKYATVILMEQPPELPVLEASELMTVLLGMLGLGGLRTFEKRSKISREQL